MSLNAIANHMASKGRGDDSMLVHMTPGEVAGLQALALKHGGSLTINPETGLVEAGFLKKLLPAVIGFGLNMFAPGLGTAIGSALGTSAAVGTGLAVGGFETLRTGSLSKGLSAGLGAYGGAGLASSMAGVGVGAAQQGAMGALTKEQIAARMAESGLTEQGVLNQAAAEATKSSLLPANAGKTLSAGFDAVKADPMAFAKDNWKLGLAAASPIIADAMVPTSTQMPTMQSTGYIRPYDYDPVGQTFKRLDPILASDLAAKPPPGKARGGLIALAEGGNPADDPYARFNTLSGQSKAAYDYLMGNAASSASQVPSTNQAPTFTSTQTPAATTSAVTPPATGGDSGGGGGASPIIGGASVGNTPSVEIDPYDQAGQDAINKIEQEVADEQYDKDRQDAIDKYESEVEQERYDQEGQDAIDKYEREIEEETQYDREGQAAIDKIEQEVEQERYDQEGQDAIDKYEREVEQERYDQEGQDAIDKYEREIADEQYDQDRQDAIDRYMREFTPEPTPEPTPSDFIPANPSDFGAVDDTGGGGDGGGDWWFDDGNDLDEDDFESAGNANGGLMGIRKYASGGIFGGGNSDLFVGYNEAPSQQYAGGGIAGYAAGGMSHLGGYSDGGRLLRGPGDGVSDSIPASIGKRRQPARLADGEFVVPARIVSELGNGSTEAGARKLYAMMDRIQKARGKTVGKGKVAANSRSDKHLPA